MHWERAPVHRVAFACKAHNGAPDTAGIWYRRGDTQLVQRGKNREVGEQDMESLLDGGGLFEPGMIDTFCTGRHRITCAQMF